MKVAVMIVVLSAVVASSAYAATYEWRRVEGTQTGTVIVGSKCTNSSTTGQKCDAAAAKRKDTIAIRNADIDGKRVEMKTLESPPAQGMVIQFPTNDHSIATIVGGAGCGDDEPKSGQQLDSLYRCEEVK